MALFVRAVVVQAYKIPSGSMIPTLLVGDHILVNKFIYGFHVPFTGIRVPGIRSPEAGDIVVFSFPGNSQKEECTSISANISLRLEHAWSSRNPFELFKDDCRDFVKRVIGVGGDRIEINNRRVFVNDILLDESYIMHDDPALTGRPRDNFGPFTVPEGSVFVMGDNRDNSYDSRYWGVVDLDKIEGRVFMMYWSWDSSGTFPDKVRWDRLGKGVG